MADASPDHLRQFLLGRLMADDADAVGARLVSDDEAGDDMAETEDALIAAYLGHALDAADREAFERHYLSTPGHRARVDARRALAARVAVAPAVTALPSPAAPVTPPTAASRAPRPSRWMALAASALLVAGLWWLRPTPQAPATPAASPSTTESPAGANAAATPAPADSLPVVTLALMPIVTRGAGTPPTATVPRGTAQVRFLLDGDLPAPAELTAEIMAVDRDEVKRWPVDAAPDTPRTAATHAVTVPVYAVPAGDYILTLWAGDADIVQRYAFRIVVP